MPEVEDRLPLRPIDRVIEVPIPPLSADQQAAREAAAARMAEFVAKRDALREERRIEVDRWEQGNLDQAREIRREYDGRN
ncbi:hypothetical protein ACIA03_16015 [Nocardioides sp. NPDC051685]|uniref:hypothetical protein n=1 Tax=Nocardioides sp. NPDC051685 TaxID=3364334 RepID=UPI0037972C4F